LSAFNVPSAAGSAAKSTSWGVDQSLTVGPFDFIAEYLDEKVEPLNSTPFTAFTANGYYILGSYYFPGKKFQLVGEYESFNPGQAKNDNLESVIGGLNYYILGDNLKLMLNYIHTWSDFRHANPSFGEDEFDEVLLRAQLMF
ncbi:MAG TPA: porin, partial [Candidatus Binatia bacterium]|nr:porin [Candidatus Binatia bacterium]